jgi:hypothetical protein
MLLLFLLHVFILPYGFARRLVGLRFQLGPVSHSSDVAVSKNSTSSHS